MHFVYVLLLLAWILVVHAAAVHDVTVASADYILQYWSTVSLSEKRSQFKGIVMAAKTTFFIP